MKRVFLYSDVFLKFFTVCLTVGFVFSVSPISSSENENLNPFTTLTLEKTRNYYGSRSSDIPIVFSGQFQNEVDCFNIQFILKDQLIRQVDITTCRGIECSGLKLIADSLSTMPNLVSLNLYNNEMKDEGFIYLCQKLSNKVQGEYPFRRFEIRKNPHLTVQSLLALINLKQNHPQLIIIDDFSAETNMEILSLLRTVK